MKEIRYQQEAVEELVKKSYDLIHQSGDRKKIVFKAPTGSGKTVMASDMLDRLTNNLPPILQADIARSLISGLHRINCMSRAIKRCRPTLRKAVCLNRLCMMSLITHPTDIYTMERYCSSTGRALIRIKT